MLKVLRCSLLVAVAACLMLAQPVIAAEGVNGNLVTVDWLEKNLKTPDVLILDASPAPMYAANHIPGAVAVDLFSYGIREVPLTEIEKRYQAWGVSPGKKIVVYDAGAGMMATRLFFDLYYHGFPAADLFVLDGGLAKWQEKGLAVTKEPTAAAKGSFTIKKVNEEERVRLPEFLTASGDTKNNVLVEALGADWHFGEVAPFGRAGHIPNGVLMPTADFYNPDKTFKSPEEIKRMLTYMGVRPEQQIYTYCGGGVAASVPYFAVKFIAHYPKVKMFKESEMGWVSDERGLPYWTYDAPFLMRDTKWLSAWGSQMLRMYGGSNISVIDVRTADAYNQGHVPFALNVPADVFKSNMANPEKLAQMLGPAGVDANHEAVVISGAGLTKDSALAFVMLEKLGQNRVSLFMDTMEKWPKLTKEATVVGPKKSPMDVSIAPTNYPASVRKGVVIADAKSTEGLYPKVFLASGKDMPAKAQEGKVVHVPYTDLLNADGTPKAASEVWNVLTKAGLPRYAEIICYSDDPGEAAVNYFVLKLMGYPDIKVLM